MPENKPENNQPPPPQVIVVRQEHSLDISKGQIAFILGFVSIFFFTLLFAPLSLVFVIISHNKKEPSGWRIGALICIAIGIVTSPTIILMIGGIGALSTL